MAESLVAGRYRLDSLLGRGGMSEVWCATDLELGRRVALKLLAPHEDNARFEREARAVAALAHPNVTQLYDYGESDGRPFMVLEYLPGGSLETLLRAHGAIADADTHRIAGEIADGLAHAHARGVVHRDLKPSNVLFDEEGRAKLSDFGIARMAAGEGTLTEAGTVLGTAAYISPEQAMGMPATPASDVYSFGALLFRMLTGRLPFESDDPIALVVAHRDTPPPLVTDVRPDAPAGLAALTGAALAKDPADRPHDGAALAAAIAGGGAAAAAITAATRVIPAAAGAAGRRRRPFAAALVGAVAILLALGGGVLAYAVTRTHDPGHPPSVTGVTLAHKHHHTQARTSTTAPTTTTTAPTTTRPPATTAPPATTTAPPPPTTHRAPTTTHRIAPPPPPATTTLSFTTTEVTTATTPTTTAATTTTAPPPTTTTG